MGVLRPLLKFGKLTCIYKHLYPMKTLTIPFDRGGVLLSNRIENDGHYNLCGSINK